MRLKEMNRIDYAPTILQACNLIQMGLSLVNFHGSKILLAKDGFQLSISRVRNCSINHFIFCALVIADLTIGIVFATDSCYQQNQIRSRQNQGISQEKVREQ